ncbi:amidohydrolase family protein [Thiohalophilus sp.]|uniref:amidohydrolase family protein n=1 Tax=Thiohalophilus sp. TaxID=3028392 RepID=UPI002ACEDB6B|nr:TatD family hydrolase [Thiohalophilus sp.]MDZ7660769.1 hypothetical protein [Thiohalophilus sp.]
MPKCLLPLLTVLLFTTAVHAERPLFDTHLHYNEADARTLTPEQIVNILRHEHIQHAVVTSTPPQHAAMLFEHDPQRIIPFLGIYRQSEDKQNWHQDSLLPDYVEQQLEDGPWRGIGELHIFAKHRHSPVLHRLVQLAARHNLPLLMHCDPAVIDTLYEIEPGVTVIWAHAGTYPYPDLLDDYLQRYPRLYIDVSVRDDRIAPDGMLADTWYNLFIQHPEKFLIGVDTYSTQRWREYGKVVKIIRTWLSQLPADVADKLSHQNADRLFKPETE